MSHASFPLSILIVDPDSVSLMIIQDLILSRWDLHIDLAGSAEGALACHDAREYHVVLIEMDLAGGGGFRLMRAMHARRPQTPVLFMTSKAHLLSAMIGSDAAGYLAKPIDAGYCMMALGHAVRYYKLQKTLRRR